MPGLAKKFSFLTIAKHPKILFGILSRHDYHIKNLRKTKFYEWQTKSLGLKNAPAKIFAIDGLRNRDQCFFKLYILRWLTNNDIFII